MCVVLNKFASCTNTQQTKPNQTPTGSVPLAFLFKGTFSIKALLNVTTPYMLYKKDHLSKRKKRLFSSISIHILYDKLNGVVATLTIGIMVIMLILN